MGKMKKINLIIVLNTWYTGGIGTYVRNIYPYLSQKYNITIISRDKIFNANSIQIKVPIYLNFWPFKEIFFFFKTYFVLKNISENNTIIFTNYSSFIPKKFDSVISIFHATHKQYVLVKKMSFQILILKLIHLLLVPLDYYRIKRSDAIVCISNNLYSTIKHNNKYYFPNGRTSSKQKNANSISKETNKVNILFVSRNDPFKGIDELLKIINYYKYNSKIKFTILGFHKKYHFHNAIFLGEITNKKKVKQYFSNTDILLSTSYLENSPNILFESMENGVVPLFRNTGDAKIILNDTNYIFETYSECIKKLDNIILNLPQFKFKIYNKVKKLSNTYSIFEHQKKLHNLIKTISMK